MYFDEMKLGMTVEIPPVVIEKEKMLSFARDYDNIPIHTDEEYAKYNPFRKTHRPGSHVVYGGMGEISGG